MFRFSNFPNFQRTTTVIYYKNSKWAWIVQVIPSWAQVKLLGLIFHNFRFFCSNLYIWILKFSQEDISILKFISVTDDVYCLKDAENK